MTNVKFVTYPILVLAVVAVLTYLYELTQPPSDYFEYYGNIPTADTFYYPERPSFFTFGDSELINIEFFNEVWCYPIGHPEVKHVKESERYNSYTNLDFQFVNPIPDVAARHLASGLDWTQFGEADRAQVREGGDQFVSWSWFADIKPTVDSTCYVNARMVSPSLIFNIPKELFVRDVGQFDYIVSHTAD